MNGEWRVEGRECVLLFTPNSTPHPPPLPESGPSLRSGPGVGSPCIVPHHGATLPVGSVRPANCASAHRPHIMSPPMWMLLSQRLLSLLQLTRMALVFTALADASCTVLLAAQRRAVLQQTTLGEQLDARQFAAAAAVSVGLYGFGMSLNDIIDRRRDQQISPGRPLPSGRLGLVAAHVVCASLLALAAGAGAYYGRLTDNWMSLVLVVFTDRKST